MCNYQAERLASNGPNSTKKNKTTTHRRHQKANATRAAIAKTKRNIRLGNTPAESALIAKSVLLNPSETDGSIRIGDLLTSVQGIGPSRMRTILTVLFLQPHTPLKRVTKHRQEALAAELDRHAKAMGGKR